MSMEVAGFFITAPTQFHTDYFEFEERMKLLVLRLQVYNCFNKLFQETSVLWVSVRVIIEVLGD